MGAEPIDPAISPRVELAKAIPRRPTVTWWLGLVFALGFALVATPTITADRWLAALGAGKVVEGQPASMTIRVPALAGYITSERLFGSGGIVIARGQIATADDAHNAAVIAAAAPRGGLPYVAIFLLTFVLGALFSHHMRRSTRGRLVRVQVVSLVAILALAALVKLLLLTTPASVLVVPVAMLAILPTMALDRVVGLATGILAALVVALLGPFDVGVAILLLVQAAGAGLVVTEQPKERWRAALTAGVMTTVFTASTYLLLAYLTTGRLPILGDPLHAGWFAAALGAAIATGLAVPLVPLYQLLVGEITRGKLIELEDLSNPLLRQIAEKAPGTWQHSLMMANMAEIAANAIGASGRLVRVGAYYHDLGKSLQPKYFIENLDPGETSPHDQLPPEVSCDAIFAHVTEGLVAARQAGLHERIIDFMHMHHGNGVLEYFWGKTREQGNPKGFSIEQFRYPGHPPQSRETAILAICDAVEAASRTLKKPDAASIDSLVQRIVYGKLHLGQLDESGLSMSDLRRISDSLRETIRHANHGRIEYPWQKAQQDASASVATKEPTTTAPRLDSLDRAPARRETTVKPTSEAPPQEITGDVALAATADLRARQDALGIVETAPALVREVQPARPSGPIAIPEPIAVPDPIAPPDPISIPDPIAASAEPSAGRRRDASSPPSRAPSQLADEAPAPRGMPSRPPPALITPATFAEPPIAARKRAATLPPIQLHRAPTVPPPGAPGRRAPTVPPPSAPGRRAPTLSRVRAAGPPAPVDLENAVTNPPPLRHRPSTGPIKPTLLIVDDGGDAAPDDIEHDDVTRTGLPSAPPADDDSETGQRLAVSPAIDDASVTAPAFPRIEDQVRTVPFELVEDHRHPEPSAPRLKMPLQAPPSSSPSITLPLAGLATGLDAGAQPRDEWSTETPVVAPSPAALRSLLGQPDPTRQLSYAELERVHRAAVAEEVSEPELLRRRIAPMPTAEVDPDDIESAIEVAPPARRAHTAIAVAKPSKKSE